jgi:hypothetical protein
VYNINYFVNKGGLDAMVARVSNTEPHLSVPLIKLHIMAWNKVGYPFSSLGAMCAIRSTMLIMLIHVVWQMREFLIPGLQKDYLPQLEICFSIMLGLGEEELRNVKKEDVEEIVRHFESIIKEYAYSETWEKTEKFCLAFALKCFRSTNLEKRYVNRSVNCQTCNIVLCRRLTCRTWRVSARLHGLSYLEEAISMTQRRKYQQWDDSSSYHSAYTNPTYRMPQVARYVHHFRRICAPSAVCVCVCVLTFMVSLVRLLARWMDSKFLLGWIQENQIIERLFQSKLSDMHPELIKRSKNLLKFMASEKFLNQVRLKLPLTTTCGSRTHTGPPSKRRHIWT